MDMYRIIGLFLILNLGLGLVNIATSGTQNSEEIYQQDSFTIWSSVGSDTAAWGDDEEQYNQDSQTEIEHSSGFSTIWLGITFLGKIVFTALFGSLDLIFTHFVAEVQGARSGFFMSIYIAAFMFMSYLYVVLGLKIYSWIRNKDVS